MNIIATAGVARSGKNTFCNVAEQILKNNGYRVVQYSFADQLKKDVADFLSDKCGIDVWSQDTEVKSKIRDFLVWYGTTFWRNCDPNHWINCVNSLIMTNEFDVALISDVRYPNEEEWVHSLGGYLVHISKYSLVMSDAKLSQKFLSAPNIQEEINDPIIKSKSDSKIEWEHLGLNSVDILSNKFINYIVLTELNKIPWITEKLLL